MDLPAGADLNALRREYGGSRLDETAVSADPYEQFGRWLDAAASAGVVDPHAMTLATSDGSGVVRGRTVLLKAYDDRGFVFATNYTSRKGRDLAEHPRAALTFHWRELERQVCVVGSVERTSAEESDRIFAARPREAQLAACASPQSEVIADRAELERLVADVTARYAGSAVPRPEHWGGVRLAPESVELWQGGAQRLHDRLRYRRSGGVWVLERLAP